MTTHPTCETCPYFFETHRRFRQVAGQTGDLVTGECRANPPDIATRSWPVLNDVLGIDQDRGPSGVLKGGGKWCGRHPAIRDTPKT
ncbi:MAG: hypothetical protein AAF661_04935 [Pseudomonadota bacterium]